MVNSLVNKTIDSLETSCPSLDCSKNECAASVSSSASPL